MRFLVIEGNIGAGKTSLAEMLAHDLNGKLIAEQFEENPFLPGFYENPERYSFTLELSFLASRYNQMKKDVLNPDLFHSLLIADYHFSKTAIFAQNTLKKDEYLLFRQLFNMASDTFPNPDLYVYLHMDTKRLLENIKKRGREYEKHISGEYLDKISEGYFSFLKGISSFPVLILDVNKFDFVQNREHYRSIKSLLFKNKYSLGINRQILC